MKKFLVVAFILEFSCFAYDPEKDGYYFFTIVNKENAVKESAYALQPDRDAKELSIEYPEGYVDTFYGWKLFPDIEKVNIFGANLTKIKFNAFKDAEKVKVLYLEACTIADLNFLNYLPSLEVVYAKNTICDFPSDYEIDLSILSNLKYLIIDAKNKKENFKFSKIKSLTTSLKLFSLQNGEFDISNFNDIIASNTNVKYVLPESLLQMAPSSQIAVSQAIYPQDFEELKKLYKIKFKPTLSNK